MQEINKIWEIAPTIPENIDIELQAIDPIIRQILFNRGLTNLKDAREYIYALIPHGSEPFNLLDMPKAVERILWAVDKNQSIAVYGDYDVDGVTATALLIDALGRLGAQVWSYIPNRFDEGYGLNLESLSSLKEQGAKLIITVDCGIRSPDEISHAQNLGMDIIITDHHSPGPEIPPAFAIINPRQPNDHYPEKNLVGVALAYKLIEAIFLTLSKYSNNSIFPNSFPNPTEYLDLVSLGTVADLAPLTGENRVLVRAGIDQLRNSKRPGLLALMGAAGISPQKITSSSIGYILGPRLNAAGRLDTAQTALNLLLANSLQDAAPLAQILDNQNRQRQSLTKESQIIAEEKFLSEDPSTPLIFIHDPNFNHGIVGLVASRLTEKYYRPAVVACQDSEYTRGSCRSIAEFNITEALDNCADLLVRYGGHSSAAGFTVENHRLMELKSRLVSLARDKLEYIELSPVINADLEVHLSDLTVELLKQLDMLQPTGRCNPQAVFVSSGLKVLRSRTVGKDQSHLKLVVSDGFITFDAIAFRQGYWQDEMPDLIDIIYNFELNEFNDRSNLQLNILDIKKSNNGSI